MNTDWKFNLKVGKYLKKDFLGGDEYQKIYFSYSDIDTHLKRIGGRQKEKSW